MSLKKGKREEKNWRGAFSILNFHFLFSTLSSLQWSNNNCHHQLINFVLLSFFFRYNFDRLAELSTLSRVIWCKIEKMILLNVKDLDGDEEDSSWEQFFDKRFIFCGLDATARDYSTLCSFDVIAHNFVKLFFLSLERIKFTSLAPDVRSGMTERRSSHEIAENQQCRLSRLARAQTLSDVVFFLSFPKSLDTVRQNSSRNLATRIYRSFMASNHSREPRELLCKTLRNIS